MFDPEIITMIDPKRDYTITEIVNHGWIVNNDGIPTRAYIQKLIKFKKLKVRDVCANPKFHCYLISGEVIINYLKDRYL